MYVYFIEKYFIATAKCYIPQIINSINWKFCSKTFINFREIVPENIGILPSSPSINCNLLVLIIKLYEIRCSAIALFWPLSYFVKINFECIVLETAVYYSISISWIFSRITIVGPSATNYLDKIHSTTIRYA